MNKNNILLLVILFLIVIAIFYGKYLFTEKFQSEYEMNNEDSEDKKDNDEIYGCKFLPWGPNLDSCVTYCKSNDRKRKSSYQRRN